MLISCELSVVFGGCARRGTGVRAGIQFWTTKLAVFQPIVSVATAFLMKLLWNGSRCYRLASQCVHSAHSLVRCDCLVGESGLIHLPVILLHSSLMCTPWQPWANAVGHVTNRLIPFPPFHLSLPPAGGLPHPSIITRSPYKSCGPICLDKACSNPSLCYLYYIDMWRGEGERGGEDCQIWWNDQQSLIRQEITQAWVQTSFIRIYRFTTLVWTPCGVIMSQSVIPF